MRRAGTGVRGRRIAALAAVVVGLSVGLAPVAEAADNPRDAEWHLDAMHASDMWNTTTGSGITVAVIDSGADAGLPDLAGQVLPGKDFSGLPGGATTDADGHGTEMASVIAGTGKSFNGKGAYGLAPGAKVLPLRVDSRDGTSGAITLKQVDDAIVYAADNGAQVINISLAVRAVDIGSSDIDALKSAVDHAIGKGSLVVAGAGNSAQQGNPIMYPAAAPGVAAVGATDENGTRTAESQTGPQLALVAPGMDIYSACTGATGYCESHGTSDATALVSASAALVWSLHPGWTGNQVLRVLLNTAGRGSDNAVRNDNVGYGAVRPRIAITTPGDPGPADVNPLVAAGVGVMPSPGSSPAAPVSSSAGSGAPAPVASSPAASTPVAAAPVGSGGASAGSGGSMVLVGGAVAGGVLLGGAAFLVRRARRGVPQG
ncbi:type VII secretion-associated serine protease mycosin [Kitasatospora sp. MAP12-15]|uniref:S8 family serine peptidase n=1 Tax=unclassified Kitasatospora TaxID=2633591 RepID=UPI00247415A1|nr:S8 family serine peptidase [Kitasatospora sp. MAP12-44]MDH6112459.1 type VII secretion-associated serine protease mycosin [Kitasatospora sp. MAP12-44]